MMKRTLPLLLLCLSLLAHAQSDGLPRPVAAALKAANIPPSHVALHIQTLGSRSPRWQHNSDEAMNPASVMKVLTTYAGLELLGPDHTWATELSSSAAIANGVLEGDLTLKGSGDPRLTFEQFWLLLRQLRAQGVREIRGDLVLDRSAFSPNGGSTPFDDQPLRPYNVKPDALLLNWKSVRLTLTPQNGQLVITAEPHPANLYLTSQITLTDGDCGEWRERLRADLSERDARTSLVITGQYAKSCTTQRWHLGVQSHAQFVYGVFRQLWEEAGGSIQGSVRDGRASDTATLLARIESPPLAEVIRDINKFSNNVMARQLYLSLGNGNSAAADTAIRTWLRQKNLSLPGLVLDNGSGLSRQERISVAGMAALLDAAWKSPYMPELMASLPITGIDGTLKKRLRDTTASAQGHLKTGTLEGVKTIAGYARDKRGQWQSVVFFVNHPNASASQAAQDALLLWLVGQ